MSPLHREMFKPMLTLSAIFMMLLLAFGWGITNAANKATAAADRAEANSASIAVNTNRISATIYTDCLTRASAANGTNLVLDQLIAGAQESKVYTLAEKDQRIALWHAVKQTVVGCVKP